MNPATLAALERAMPQAAFVAAMRAGAEAFAAYRASLPHLEATCSRTLLHTTPEFELIAMRWAPGSRTAIHDHARSRCWVLMLDGELHVMNYERTDDRTQPFAQLQHTETLLLRRDDLDHRSGPREFHRVENNSGRVAHSLQLYAQPLTIFTAIEDEATGRTMSVTAKYDGAYLLAQGDARAIV